MDLLEKILRLEAVERFKRNLGKYSGLYFRLKRFTPSASEPLRVAMNINQMGIDCVIDVGANKGQFGQSLYDFNYRGKIISFEPVFHAHQLLVKRANNHPNWTVAKRCAIGPEDGKTTINVSDDSVFSSILEINKDYTRTNPKSCVVATEEVPMYTLDSIISNFLSGNEKILLKIDTQGYEKEVLQGAANLLKVIYGLKIEIPLYPIYENSTFNFYEMIEFVRDLGLTPYSFNVEGVDLDTGRVNTIDGLFFTNKIYTQKLH